MRFILFVQQYTNFPRCFFSLRLLNEQRKTYQQHRVHSSSTLMCSFVDLGAWHDARCASFWNLCVCIVQFSFLSFFRCTIYFHICVLHKVTFLETSKYTLHTLTLALHCTAMHCLRPGKFQFYCTVCNLILLVYIINRWMAGQMASCFTSYNFNFAYDRNACFKRDGLVAWNPLRNQPINYSIH